MERLVDNIYTFKGKVEDVENDYIIKVQEKLKAYEDKQEQGLLIELKAKIGDAVYTICGEEIECDIVREIMILPNKTFYLDCHRSVIGSTPNIYLTEAEAEEALAKMGGK